jgi:hypothetical protein
MKAIILSLGGRSREIWASFSMEISMPSKKPITAEIFRVIYNSLPLRYNNAANLFFPIPLDSDR